MRPLARSRPGAVGALLALTMLSGCTTGGGDDAPATTSTAPSPTAATATASASPSPTVTGFDNDCSSALSIIDIGTAAGQPIIGNTAFVVGEPDPSIGRLAYLNCRYGISSSKRPPSLEIGVSRYDSADRAAARVRGTVEDFRNTGSTAKQIPVGSATGTLLISRGQPATLVVAGGDRTVAVSLVGALYTGEDQIAAIAKLALDNVQ